jgi:glycosyltransferase involved in cell wall biosynthesis
VVALCEAVPRGSVILMGPVARGEVSLPKLPNLHVLPPRQRYIELAGVLRAADVGLIPYRPDPYAGAMHPAKLNEYLVFGLPVVATATEELKCLAAEWPEGTLYLAASLEQFSGTACHALKRSASEARVQRQMIIEKNNWGTRVREFFLVVGNP